MKLNYTAQKFTLHQEGPKNPFRELKPLWPQTAGVCFLHTELRSGLFVARLEVEIIATVQPHKDAIHSNGERGLRASASVCVRLE